MGSSLPPPSMFDLIDSYARHRGAEIEVALARPVSKLAESSAVVTFSYGTRRVKGAGVLTDDGDGATLTVRAPRDRLTNGTWTMTVRTGPSARERLGARLLVQGQRPPVLLWGAQAPESVVPVRQYPRLSRQRVAVKAGTALDRALTVLPQEKAKRIRSRLRTSARRVLG